MQIYVFFPSDILHVFHSTDLRFSHMHIMRRSHSRQAGSQPASQASAAVAVVRWPSVRFQRHQIPAGDVADCWPRTQQCRLWTHCFMVALALMQHLIGWDELFAVAAWGSVPLYTSYCLYLIRSPLPLVCILCIFAHVVYQFMSPFLVVASYGCFLDTEGQDLSNPNSLL